MPKVTCPKCHSDKVIANWNGSHIICLVCKYESGYEIDRRGLETEDAVQEAIREAKNANDKNRKDALNGSGVPKL